MNTESILIKINKSSIVPNPNRKLRGEAIEIHNFQDPTTPAKVILDEDQAEFIFEFEDIKIPCKKCGTLILLEDGEDEDWVGSESVCLECGTENYFEVKYERIEDALKRN